jgi:dTDP-4-amino-4,6-dideoxygalactose transaminase
MIPFNRPTITGREIDNIQTVIEQNKISGDGNFTKKCNEWFVSNFLTSSALLTTSCTHALEMAAILADIQEGDEVLMPSYTFVSTANAFVLRGARIVFVDIRPDTMNINECLIEAAITRRTKAIVPVHYAGVACEMDMIMDIAKRYDLCVIEDAAQGVMSKYKDKFLGTIGDMGCYSFHETKNYNCGEGGALLLDNEIYVDRAEVIREKGTNRSRYFRGQVDKYTWVDIGSSYLPSELNAAFLYGQLENANEINEDRLGSWNIYYDGLKRLADEGVIELPTIPEYCNHNAHMFYIKVKDLDERSKVIQYLKDNGVQAVFHYVPLHSSTAGMKYGRFHDFDLYTTRESERLLRLPMFYGIERPIIERVINVIEHYYSPNRNTVTNVLMESV